MDINIPTPEKTEQYMRYSQAILDMVLELNLEPRETYSILVNTLASFHFMSGGTVKDWEEITMALAETFNNMGKP
jgi:hypothetical protein